MTNLIEKVTAFITRQRASRTDLLLFEHPHAGIQIPAGTIEPGETPEAAVLREASEESGLSGLRISRCLGTEETKLPEDQRVIGTHTKVYSRPDPTSFDWAQIRTGITVSVIRGAGQFVQIQYREYDQVPDPQFISYEIKGWVPVKALTDTIRRHFYHLTFCGSSPERWETATDNHIFNPFWASLGDLPDIIPPQNQWLTYLEPLFPKELANK